jgi:membrane protease subunit (stomatin/prohibitin family)
MTQREKQIEKMACAMCGQDKICGGVGVEKCIIYPGYRRQANRLYNAGYRKQSEGEWIWINQAKGYLEPPFGDTCKCSLCEFEIDISESNYKFCPNCGAKMKGV